jgi:hypothetical protein
MPVCEAALTEIYAAVERTTSQMLLPAAGTPSWLRNPRKYSSKARRQHEYILK